tara:strand:+ start:77 stop:643 length:567 start_codon:yes stop_codon:yes gene_type:complete
MFKILFIILALFYTDSFAKKKTGRISFGGGLHNFMKNGYSICRAPAYGGCDPNSSANAALPVPYKEISTVFSFEYFAKRNIFKIIKPLVGYNYTSKEAHYGYFGLSADLFFGDCKCFIVTPTLAAGWYIDGDEIRLGHKIEFRSGGDIYYRFKNNVRVGVGFYHISNAGIGESNPGAEQAIFKYQIPF